MISPVVFVLFICVCISESEVLNDFSKCDGFFYQNSAPRGFERLQPKPICQVYKNVYRFASLYSIQHRIPLYSAYRLDAFTCPATQPTRRSKWFIEPQLNGNGSKSMTTEGSMYDWYKKVQAINIDFPNTNYDRGHLNPNFYQCDDSRTATFTLTNCVPQDPCFNQQIWKDMEEMSKKVMETHCSFAGAKRYFITGAVPTNKKIPSKYHDKEGDQTRDYDRVSVPSVMWTAACCDSTNAHSHEDRDKGFSFGYYGDNKPDSWVIPLSVPLLDLRLRSDYMSNTIKVFADSCFSDSKNSKIVLREISVPVERKVAETLVDMSKSSESSVPPNKRRLVMNVNENLHTNKAVAMKDWKFADVDFGMQENRNNIQNTRNLLASIAMTSVFMKSRSYTTDYSFSSSSLKFVSDASTKLLESPSDLTNGAAVTEYTSNHAEGLNIIEGDQYIIVESFDVRFSASTSRCREDHQCGLHGKAYSWCYIDWKNNWDYCCSGSCGFGQGTSYAWCYSGSNSKWAYCSQRSSMVSVSGKQCLHDHECGLHGESYHWCYTDLTGNWEYCCQPWHECSTHDESYKWCYVSNKRGTNPWEKCYY